ncbi:riboflavin synthase [Sulfurospirillum arcachonense]|uniref:riboflavin synthase n=1 Tax=Sulfurospirillum arcachonense TaxID=57666 RepID=UPI0004692B36|nr:riboflavin synthase [Sulfurospirillum arcachonense]
MFTGLIREFATVVSYENSYLTLKAKYKPGIGDSIATNGVCLTVVSVAKDTFTVELSAETREIMAIENLKGKVHIEPAMAIGDRLEGHIVQGHIDCVGTIKSITKNQNATDMVVALPKEYQKFIIPKGSIAIDGVSLTLNDIKEDGFRLTIIAHTLDQTIFSDYRVGRRVNIETDMFARYIYHMFKGKKEITWDNVDNLMALY